MGTTKDAHPLRSLLCWRLADGGCLGFNRSYQDCSLSRGTRRRMGRAALMPRIQGLCENDGGVWRHLCSLLVLAAVACLGQGGLIFLFKTCPPCPVLPVVNTPQVTRGKRQFLTSLVHCVPCWLLAGACCLLGLLSVVRCFLNHISSALQTCFQRPSHARQYIAIFTAMYEREVIVSCLVIPVSTRSWERGASSALKTLDCSSGCLTGVFAAGVIG